MYGLLITKRIMKQYGFAYNPYEQRILATLTYAYRTLTTLQISKFAGISYNSTKKYLDILHKKKKIKRKVESNKIYWEI